MATRRRPARIQSTKAAKHEERMALAGMPNSAALEQTAALQHSHDTLAEQLAVVLGQCIYGHHSPLRYQLIHALRVLREAVPLSSEASGRLNDTHVPHTSWIDAALERVSPRRVP